MSSVAARSPRSISHVVIDSFDSLIELTAAPITVAPSIVTPITVSLKCIYYRAVVIIHPNFSDY